MKTQGVGEAGSDSPISMTICQDNRCCKTGTMDSPGADHDQSQLNEYEGNYLGGCKGFSLTKAPVVKLKIQGTDGWCGDWIKIFTGSKISPNQGAYCNVDVWLDDNEEITLSCSIDKPGMSITKIVTYTASFHDAGTDDKLYANICRQNGACCKTNILDGPGDDFQVGATNVFTGKTLGSCENWSWTGVTEAMMGIHGTDGWVGRFDIHLANGKVVKCTNRYMVDNDKCESYTCTMDGKTVVQSYNCKYGCCCKDPNRGFCQHWVGMGPYCDYQGSYKEPGCTRYQISYLSSFQND